MAILTECVYSKVCNCEEPCESCIRWAEMKYLLEKSNLPQSKWLPTILSAGEDYNAFIELSEIKSNIVEFVDKHQNLLITSENTGNGKTSWAIKLLLKYFDEIWAGNGFRVRGVFIHTPTFLLKLKDFDNKSYEFETLKQNILNTDLVVFDDIGASDLSSYDYTQLSTYIDQRLLSDKSTIFTTNLNQQQLQKHLGVRLASRVYNTSTVIQFVGKDKRPNRMKFGVNEV